MSTFETVVSAYSPQSGGDKMEGGYESSRKGPDGKFAVRTLADYQSGSSPYVTVAGHPALYNKKYTISKISFINSAGHLITLLDVPVVVHDTGSAFKSESAKNAQRFDVPADSDLTSNQINRQPYSMTKVLFTPGWALPGKDVTNIGSTVEPSVAIKEPESVDVPWMVTAKSLLGIKEVPGYKDNAKIMAWAKAIGSTDYTADSIPWCGLFVGYVMDKHDKPLPDSPLWALDWLKVGVKVSKPGYGCIMCFKRSGGGHVGFYISEDDTTYHILGGNQSDMVCVTRVSKAQFKGARWPADEQDLLAKFRGPIYKALSGKIVSAKELG